MNAEELKKRLKNEIGESNCYMEELTCTLKLKDTESTKKLMIAIRDIHANPLLEDHASIDISFFTIEDENANEENTIQEKSEKHDQNTEKKDQDAENQDQNAENQDKDTQNQKPPKKKKGSKKKTSTNTESVDKEKQQGVTEDIPEEMNFLLKDVDIKENQFTFSFTFTVERNKETKKETKKISFERNDKRLVDQILLYLKNSIELKKILKTEKNFDKIYKICDTISTDKDKDAMSLAVREKFVYVTGKDGKNIFTKAADDNNQELVRLLIESGIDINIEDRDKCTALYYAEQKGHL